MRLKNRMARMVALVVAAGLFPARALPSGSARPSSSKLTTVPAMLIRRTGRLPCRSERRPSIGAPISCAAAYEAASRPTTKGDAP